MAGTLTISTLSDGTNSTSSTNCIQGSAKAFVRFVGGTTPTITNSYNISSVTQSATGFYVFTFTNALSNANYSVIGSASPNTGATQCFTTVCSVSGSNYQAPTTTGFTAEVCTYAGARATCNLNAYLVLGT